MDFNALWAAMSLMGPVRGFCYNEVIDDVNHEDDGLSSQLNGLCERLESFRKWWDEEMISDDCAKIESPWIFHQAILDIFKRSKFPQKIPRNIPDWLRFKRNNLT
jgi:hypothetical protein